MKTIVVDPTSAVPAWGQIKDQIKLAYAVGRLNDGDVLPSIRSLAKRLDVSDAVVRRAYDELTELGLLSAEPRKHLMVTDSLSKPAAIGRLAREAGRECDRMLAWAREHGLSAIAVARMLLLRATEEERRQPTYVYVDASPAVSVSFAETIAEAWEIPVRGLSLREIVRLSEEELSGLTAVLVNAYRHEDAKRILSSFPGDRILPVRVRLHRRLVRKLKSLPAGSAVLFVLQDVDATHISRPVVDYVQAEVGGKLDLSTVALGALDDLAAVAAEKRYRLIVVSGHVWEDVPERARGFPNVVPSENELIPESLEKARVRAGVLV